MIRLVKGVLGVPSPSPRWPTAVHEGRCAMPSPAKALRHAIHPVLIVFPLSLLRSHCCGLRRPVLHHGQVRIRDRGWLHDRRRSHWWASRRHLRFRRLARHPDGDAGPTIGALHGAGNVVVLVLFAASWLVRYAQDTWDTTAGAFVLALLGVALGGVTGWLGGELVERLGVGVDEGANLDAPSSLSHRVAAGGPTAA